VTRSGGGPGRIAGVLRLVRPLWAGMRDRWGGARTPGRGGRWWRVRAWSLRWRVTALGAVVVALTLVVVGLMVNLSLSSTLTRDQQDRVADRAGRADVLLAQGVAPDDVVSGLDGNGVRVDHRAGNALLAPGPRGEGSGVDAVGRDAPASPSPPAGPPKRPKPLPPDSVVRPLPDGTALVFSVDPGEVDAVLAPLRALMLAGGAVGLVGAVSVLGWGMRRALSPLETMTTLARAITAGDRGQRLRPARTDTEIGATAAAFDDMLDALEHAALRAHEAAAEARHAEHVAREAERVARGAERAARRSEATTRQFLADAAHELRTPLAGTQALAETLVRDPDDDPAAREELAITLVRETARASGLVTDMLDLARLEEHPALHCREVDLVELIADATEGLRLIAPQLRLDLDPPRGRGAVRAEVDPPRIAQILANLLDNARRHTPDAGTITVRTTSTTEVATISVHNTGPVIAAADRERIFARLVRLDQARTRTSDGGGAGLGLPIARALARAHHGELICSPSDTGAEFTLTLPRTTDGTDGTDAGGDADRDGGAPSRPHPHDRLRGS